MRTVLVTGGGRGIGAQTARLFSERGDQVYALDLRFDEAETRWTTLECDLRDPGAIDAAIGRVIEQAGRLDVVVNNAGVRTSGDVVDTTLEDWEHVFAVNSTAVFLCCRRALPIMLQQKAGVIVNVASMAGLTPMWDRAAYCASKGAVIALTKQIALQYASKGIRANAVCPGPTLTPFVKSQLERGGQAHSRERAYAERQPMKRLATPDEIASAIFYLASADASFVTGIAMAVDGGVALANSM